MTSSIHHLVADLSARLDHIERTLLGDYEAYQAANGDGSNMNTLYGIAGHSSDSATYAAKTGSNASSPTNTAPAQRLNLSQRLATITSTFNKSLLAGTASEISDRLQFISSALLPSYITSEVIYEPDRKIDSEATAQRYAVIKRRLNSDAQREMDQLKLNMKALADSTFATDGTGAVIADVLAYNGPQSKPADGSEAPAMTSPRPTDETDIRDWVNRAAINNRRAQELHLRLAKAKARYESLVNYSNKQMCVWDLQIEELEKRAKRQTALRK